MKIVCDHCAKKYSIADEKIRGRVFKTRCKECGHVLIIHGEEPERARAPSVAAAAPLAAATATPARAATAKAAPSRAATAKPAPIAAAPKPAPESPPDADEPSDLEPVWHVVIDGESVGPMSGAEIRSRFTAGQISVENYGWREGYGEWLPLKAIADFAQLQRARAVYDRPITVAGEISSQRGESEEEVTRRTTEEEVLAAHAVAHPEEPGAAEEIFGSPHASQEDPPTNARAPNAAAAKPSLSDEETRQARLPPPAPARRSPTLAPTGRNGGVASVAVAGMPQSSGSAEVITSAPAPQSPPPSAMSRAAVPDEDDDATALNAGRLTGQRNENSLLFSLDSLRSMSQSRKAAAAAAATRAEEPAPLRPGFVNSTKEGSGLIDIRAMAAETMSSSSNGSNPASVAAQPEGPSVFDAAIPAPLIIAPMRRPGVPIWAWLAMGGGTVVVLILALVLAVLLQRRPAQVYVEAPLPQPTEPVSTVATSPPPVQPSAPEKPLLADTEKPAANTPANTIDQPAVAAATSAKAAATEKPAAKRAAPEEERPAPVKATAPPVKPARAAKPEPREQPAHRETPKAAQVEREPKPAPSPPPPSPPAERPRKASASTSADDADIEALLGHGSKKSAPAAHGSSAPAAVPSAAASSAASDLPEQLGRDDIKSGMSSALPRARACYQQFHIKGTAMVALTIESNGRISGATVKGDLADTQSGDCVSRALRQAVFKKFKGATMNVTYPVVLQ